MRKFVVVQNTSTNEWEIKEKDNEEITYGHYETVRDALSNGRKRIFFERLYNASISEKIAILTFLITLLSCIIKFLIERKYNSYFCIPDTWNSNFLEDILSQIMFYAGTIVVVFITNFSIYFCIVYVKKMLKAIFIAFPFIVVIFIVLMLFDDFPLIEKVFLCIGLFFSLFWMGWFMGLAKSFILTKLKKANDKKNKYYKNLSMGKCSLFVFASFIFLLLFFIGNLGLAFAKERKKFQITTINNQSMVIMAEKDNLYLLAKYKIINNNVIEIYVNEFYPVPKENISIILVNFFNKNQVLNSVYIDNEAEE